MLATRRGKLTLLLLACAIFLLAATAIALRTTNTRGEPAAQPDPLPVGHGMTPAAELTDEAANSPANTPQQQT